MSTIVTHREGILGNLFTGLISSKTRIKLLVRFFFNPNTGIQEGSPLLMITTTEKRRIIKSLVWDYHIQPDSVLSGLGFMEPWLEIAVEWNNLER